MPVDALSNASLRRIRQMFGLLEPAPAEMRAGAFRARFIGPWWLRASAGPSIALSGLLGWWGKRFLDAETATNVLDRAGGDGSRSCACTAGSACRWWTAAPA